VVEIRGFEPRVRRFDSCPRNWLRVESCGLRVGKRRTSSLALHSKPSTVTAGSSSGKMRHSERRDVGPIPTPAIGLRVEDRMKHELPVRLSTLNDASPVVQRQRRLAYNQNTTVRVRPGLLNIDPLAEQSGVLATLSRWRSWVQVPSRGLNRARYAIGKAAKLKPSWFVGSTPSRASGTHASAEQGRAQVAVTHPPSGTGGSTPSRRTDWLRVESSGLRVRRRDFLADPQLSTIDSQPSTKTEGSRIRLAGPHC
jgi:hypothetical protein